MRSFAAISKLFIMKIYMLNMHQLDWVGCLLAALVLRFIQFWLCRVCDLKYHRNASFRLNEREWSERMQSKEKMYSEMEWNGRKKKTHTTTTITQNYGVKKFMGVEWSRCCWRATCVRDHRRMRAKWIKYRNGTSEQNK